MNVIGFNFTKISGEKTPDFSLTSSLNTDIQFTSMKEEKISILKEDSSALGISFRFVISYSDKKEKKEKDEKESQMIFEGKITLSLAKEEPKDVIDKWEKKTLPNSFKVPLFNLILKRCAAKAMQLEEELNLPSHVPIPQIHPQQGKLNKNDNKK